MHFLPTCNWEHLKCDAAFAEFARKPTRIPSLPLTSCVRYATILHQQKWKQNWSYDIRNVELANEVMMNRTKDTKSQIYQVHSYQKLLKYLDQLLTPKPHCSVCAVQSWTAQKCNLKCTIFKMTSWEVESWGRCFLRVWFRCQATGTSGEGDVGLVTQPQTSCPQTDMNRSPEYPSQCFSLHDLSCIYIYILTQNSMQNIKLCWFCAI